MAAASCTRGIELIYSSDVDELGVFEFQPRLAMIRFVISIKDRSRIRVYRIAASKEYRVSLYSIPKSSQDYLSRFMPSFNYTNSIFRNLSQLNKVDLSNQRIRGREIKTGREIRRFRKREMSIIESWGENYPVFCKGNQSFGGICGYYEYEEV